MSLSYAILVTGSPTDPAASHALRFAEQLLQMGHSIIRIFFFGEGVHHANKLTTPSQDETAAAKAWQGLGAAHNVELVVCISSALRRGVVDHDEAERYELDCHNLQDGFEIGGLGLWVEACLQADRCLRFGAGQ